MSATRSHVTSQGNGLGDSRLTAAAAGGDVQAVVADAVPGAVDQRGGLRGGGVRGEQLVQEGEVVAPAGFDENFAGGGALVGGGGVKMEWNV